MSEPWHLQSILLSSPGVKEISSLPQNWLRTTVLAQNPSNLLHQLNGTSPIWIYNCHQAFAFFGKH